MSSELEIKKLSEVLGDYLGPNKEIVDSKMALLTAPGENYGSIMLKLDLTVKNGKGSTENIHAVAKKIPSSQIVQGFFNVQVTFKNEAAIYTTVAPTLTKFQRQQGVTEVLDCFADLYGARFNLNENSDVVDANAVLIVENLIAAGYRNIDRTEGFDLEGSKLLLKSIAKFHAVPLALKLKKPEVFEQKVKSACAVFKPDMGFLATVKHVVKRILSHNDQCITLLHKIYHWGERPTPKPREPFATLTHGDLWTNNTMQKIVDGKWLANKIVDFQACDYRSPASDVFFFIWSSIQLNVLQEHLDYLFKYYHENFIQTLEELKCDTAPFSYKHFLEEVRLEAEVEFGHALQFAIFVVNGKKGGSMPDFDAPVDMEKIWMNISEAAKEKACYMVLECEKRGWLY